MMEWIIGGGIGVCLIIMGINFKENGKFRNEVVEFQKATEENFVRKDICKILSRKIEEDITEIKRDVKSLLKHSGIE